MCKTYSCNKRYFLFPSTKRRHASKAVLLDIKPRIRWEPDTGFQKKILRKKGDKSIFLFCVDLTFPLLLFRK